MPSLIWPTSTNTTNKSPSPITTTTATESAEVSQHDQETVFETATYELEYDNEHSMNDNLQDWMTLVTPIPGQPPSLSPQEEDDDAEELYNDFAKDYWLPTTCQHSQPALSTAIKTNYNSAEHQSNPTATSLPANVTATLPPRQATEDRLNSSLPKKLGITKDHLLQSIGHINLDKLIKLLPQLVKADTILIQMDTNSKINIGHHATINNKKGSKTSVQVPEKFGDVWHVNIGFRSSKAIGGAPNCLFFIDRKTQYKHVFPLKILKEDLLLAMHKFITKVGCHHIGRLYTDFDEKNNWGDVQKLLDEEHIPITAAPRRCQSENGLMKYHWK